jgi:hypothetical protein
MSEPDSIVFVVDGTPLVRRPPSSVISEGNETEEACMVRPSGNDEVDPQHAASRVAISRKIARARFIPADFPVPPGE